MFTKYIGGKKLLYIIIATAFVLRVIGIGYGLPFHLFSDEEALIYGALRMIELKTFLPVFHWQEFNGLLYYPPFLSFIYTLAFLPALVFKYVLSGFPTFSSFREMLVLNTSLFWYIARFIVTCFSVGNIYLVYLITNHFFRDKKLAILSSLFLTVNFVDITVSSTARHWVPTLFFSLLSLYSILLSISHDKNKLFPILSGIFLGVSFGMGYLVFFFPIVVFVLIFFFKDKKSILFDKLFYFLSSFLIVALIAIVLHPQPFIEQVLFHMYPRPGTTKSLSTFFSYYARVLWYYDPVATALSTLGFFILFLKDRRLWFIFFSFYLFTSAIMYIFLWNIPRYLSPAMPFISILAAYGFFQLGKKLEPISKYNLTACLAIILFAYYFLTFGRFGYLIIKSDTRVSIKQWVEKNISKESQLIIDSERIRFVPTRLAAQLQENFDPNSLRSVEKLAISKGFSDLPNSRASYNIFNIRDIDAKQSLLKSILDQPGKKYFVSDSYSMPVGASVDLIRQATLIKQFVGDINIIGGLFIGGEEQTVSTYLTKILFKTKQFGPTVSVYEL